MDIAFSGLGMLCGLGRRSVFRLVPGKPVGKWEEIGDFGEFNAIVNV